MTKTANTQPDDTHRLRCGCASATGNSMQPNACSGGDADRAGHAQSRLDPVCGMNVDPATSRHRFAYRSETFHFCSAGCRARFAADPAKYLDRS